MHLTIYINDRNSKSATKFTRDQPHIVIQKTRVHLSRHGVQSENDELLSTLEYGKTRAQEPKETRKNPE